MFPVEFTVLARDGSARTGTARTARGDYTTPLFMPVGTRGAVKYLSADDYERLGARIVLGNTYHLMLRPGAEVVRG
ncbi:MAG: tRNA-guanine transglycosylase, partial [Ilumatobacter sp.]